MLEKLGSGGVGDVYKARDILLKRIVAIKVLNTVNLEDEHIVRLHREARTICKLEHPNIIDVYDFILSTDNTPVLVMKYIEGETLKKLIKERGAIEQDLALVLVEQLVRALEYAHEHGVLHRDLKPANVMVEDIDDRCELRIIDFGIAKVQELDDTTITGSGSIVGTPSYMSPEQAKNETVDGRSDIYSLGCMLYEIFTGKKLFYADTTLDIIRKQLREPAPSLKEGNDSIKYSQELENLVAKMLKKSPQERFQNMTELLEEVSRIKGLEPRIKIDLPEMEKNGSGFVSKHLVPTIFSLIALTTTLFGLVLWGLSQQQESAHKNAQAQFKKAYEIRYEHGIDQNILSGRVWLSLKGEITNERLQALQKLDVKRLDLSNSSISDKQLEALVNLPIIILDLRGTEISDQGIKTIAEIKGLRSLLIGNCKNLTGKSLKELHKINTLEVLDLSGSSIKDREVKEIAKCPKLYLLYLSNCPNITDHAIDELMKLEKLSSLRLGGTRVTKSGIEKLKGHERLTFIGLHGLDIGGENMPTFSRNITMLDVSSTNITDGNVVNNILNLPDIWYLNLRGCQKNLSNSTLEVVYKRMRISKGRVAIIDLLPDLRKREWYLDPELVWSMDLKSTETRKRLIEEQMYGSQNIMDVEPKL